MKDYQKKYGDRQDQVEAITEGNVRLGRGPGLAGVGAALLVAAHLLKYTLPTFALYILAVTAPLGLLMLGWAWIRLPMRAKFSGRALGAAVTTLLLGALTLYLVFGGGDGLDIPELPTP